MRSLLALLLLLGTTLAGASDAPAWVLSWSDEFDSGTAPDPAKWTLETGGHGWGNHELQYYTARPENARLAHGNLAITALAEDYTGPDGVARRYTSARLKTAGKFEQAYGRFEARIKLPAGQGIWPAFWMLGNDIAAVGWPACGEIDIMENIGREPATNHGSAHGPGFFAGRSLTGALTLRSGRLGDGFHLFALEWEPGELRFYVDGELYQTRTPADLPAGGRWVFDHPFFLLLNVAVGGDWPGAPDASTRFPQTMLVDYVRVYRRPGPGACHSHRRASSPAHAAARPKPHSARMSFSAVSLRGRLTQR